MSTIRLLQSPSGKLMRTTNKELEEACTKVLRWRSALQFGSIYNRFKCATDEQVDKVVDYLLKEKA